MKFLYFFLLSLLISTLAAAQVSKTINVATPGTLSVLLTSTEKTTLTNLTVTGNIDARDIKCMRDEITMLTILDISAVLIKSYYGSEGTSNYNEKDYFGDNSLPQYSFSNSGKGNTTLISIILPTSLKSIDDYAFMGCTALDSITIPNSVTSIGDNVFFKAKWYDDKPNGLVYIGKVLYKYKGTMPSNTIISVLEGTVEITYIAFSGCTGLTSITIPTSVTSIGGSAFLGCTGLTSITIPNSVTDIGYEAFWGCTSLTSVTIPNSVTSIAANTFEHCTSLSSIIIPNSVTDIGYRAFYECFSLTSITIPNSVVNIQPEAFGSCTSLTTITIPNSVKSIETAAFKACSSLNHISLPNSITSISRDVFSDCTSLTSITIPSSVINIDYNAFTGCTALSSITIPSSVTIIEDRAFYNTKWYNDKPNGLVYVGKILYNYKGTMPINTSITVLDGTVSISSGAFSGCIGLNAIYIPNSVISVGALAFEDTKWYNDKPNGSVYIGKSLYKYKGTMPKNTNITILGGTVSISSYAFGECNSLRSITIPNTVINIGPMAFAYCTSLSSIALPNSLTSIEYGTFGECIGLTSISIPNSVTSIGGEVFKDCRSLTSIRIPNSVVNVGYGAFRECSSLNEIIVDAVVPPIVLENTFKQVNKSAIVYVPTESISLYKDAYGWRDFFNINCVANTTQVQQLDEPSCGIRIIDKNIEITNAKGSKINVYDISGRVLFTKKVSQDSENIQLSNKGVYLLAIDGFNRKIIVD